MWLHSLSAKGNGKKKYFGINRKWEEGWKNHQGKFKNKAAGEWGAVFPILKSQLPWNPLWIDLEVGPSSPLWQGGGCSWIPGLEFRKWIFALEGRPQASDGDRSQSTHLQGYLTKPTGEVCALGAGGAISIMEWEQGRINLRVGWRNLAATQPSQVFSAWLP